MEKLSRVKKYEELRKSIEVDNSIDNSLHTHTSVEQEEALKKFDSSIFKKVEIQEDTSYTPEREKEFVHAEEHKPLTDDTFTNEYLDDFIKEVRDYNIKKGNRESENTQADILYQLNASNRAKRSQYIQEIKDDLVEEEPKKTVLSKDDIALEVANLLREDMDEEPQVSPVEEEEEFPSASTFATDSQPDEMLQFTRELNLSRMRSYDEREEQTEEIEVTPEEVLKKKPAYEKEKELVEQPVIRNVSPKAAKKVIQPVLQEEFETDEVVVQKKPKDTVLHKKLLEETQQLRVQMDEYEDELTDLSDGVEKTNKLLNFVLCFLILVLLVIIGFIVYSLWKAGGI